MNRKRGLVVGLVAAIVLLSLAVTASISYKRLASYRFLNGHEPVFRHKDNSHNTFTLERVTYSFMADYNTVCVAAKAELLSMGYIDQTDPIDSSQRHEFQKLTTNQIAVTISEGDVYDAELTRDRPNWPYFIRKPGWISVEIVRFKPKFNIKTFCRYWSRRLILISFR